MVLARRLYKNVLRVTTDELYEARLWKTATLARRIAIKLLKAKMDAPYAVVDRWQRQIGLAANALAPSVCGSNRPILAFARPAIESLW